jgi:hypothetical protein
MTAALVLLLLLTLAIFAVIVCADMASGTLPTPARAAATLRARRKVQPRHQASFARHGRHRPGEPTVRLDIASIGKPS